MFGEGSADRIEGAMDLERREGIDQDSMDLDRGDGSWIGIQWIGRVMALEKRERDGSGFNERDESDEPGKGS